MPMKKQVISIRETTKLNARGDLVRWVVVEYMLDNFGPFIHEEGKETFAYDNLKVSMRIQEEGIASIKE